MTNTQNSSTSQSVQSGSGVTSQSNPLATADIFEEPKVDVDPLASPIKFAEEEHQYLREYIRNADQKAIFFFALCSGLLAFFNSKNATANWLKPIYEWTMLDLDVFVAMSCLTISAALFLFVVIPKLKGSKRGIIFFKAVNEYSNSNDYVSDIIRSTKNDIARAKLQHCYELAKICCSKYNKLVFALYIGALGMVATLIYLLV